MRIQGIRAMYLYKKRKGFFIKKRFNRKFALELLRETNYIIYFVIHFYRSYLNKKYRGKRKKLKETFTDLNKLLKFLRDIKNAIKEWDKEMLRSFLSNEDLTKNQKRILSDLIFDYKSPPTGLFFDYAKKKYSGKLKEIGVPKAFDLYLANIIHKAGKLDIKEIDNKVRESEWGFLETLKTEKIDILKSETKHAVLAFSIWKLTFIALGCSLFGLGAMVTIPTVLFGGFKLHKLKKDYKKTIEQLYKLMNVLVLTFTKLLIFYEVGDMKDESVENVFKQISERIKIR